MQKGCQGAAFLELRVDCKVRQAVWVACYFLPAIVLPATVFPATVFPAKDFPATVLPATVLPANVLPATVRPAMDLPAVLRPASIRAGLFTPEFIEPGCPNSSFAMLAFLVVFSVLIKLFFSIDMVFTRS